MEEEREMKNFGDTFSTFDSQSVFSTCKSGDSLVKFMDVNIISNKSSKRIIDYQLKANRDEKHKEYLWGIIKLTKYPKQCDNLQDRNVDKSKTKETNNQSPWPSGTPVIVGDSMVNSIDEK